MRPKPTAPPSVDIERLVKIGGLFYPEPIKGIVRHQYKKWEEQMNTVLPLALEHVKQFKLAIDGGAFVGAWSRVLAFDEVIAFEPVGRNFQCLVRNAPNALAYRMALADYEGTIDLRMNEGAFATTRRGAGITKKTKSYPCVPLDMFHVEPDLIKLDLDGSDLAALKGMTETLERCSPVIIVEHKLDEQGIKGHMKSLDYECRYTDRRDSIWTR